ncbi:MAG: hypothetical protein A3E79_06620 [Burkholderiales bacterium RIFCSPHIGHO2_12_FULL_61_11]|nr:MAG: hypothetical protein A3E79_06620 [Burkholderiales bacterium RIFCSPHIGHO2_12_FULL_61_11]
MKNHDDFSAQELELHIKHCGDLMKSAMARYELSGCLGDRGEADGWRMAMERAIAARGPAQVIAMENYKGLYVR